MADEVKTDNPDSNVVSDVTTDTVDDKQSNKTFSQSDFDQALSKEISKVKTQFDDYDKIKEGYLEMKKWKEQKELENMTEIEKFTKLVETTTNENELLKQANVNLLRESVKHTVLLDKKYAHLPMVYKQAVVGDTQETVIESADSMLVSYIADLKTAGKPVDNIAVPSDIRADVTQKLLPTDVNNMMQNSLNNKIKNQLS